MKRFLILLLVLALTLLGCGTEPNQPTTDPTDPSNTGTTGPSNTGITDPNNTDTTVPVTTAPPVNTTDTEDLFSDRDQAGTYEEDETVTITLSGSTAACDSRSVTIDGGTITITGKGTYLLTGTLEGMVIVDVTKDEKVQLVLSNASITSPSSAAVYVRQADKVFLTTGENTDNSLANGGSFEAIDENNIDAVIFSKDDLTLNGSGKLTITSPAGHGIVSKDELTVTGGAYTVTTASHGLCGKDSVAISGGSFTITSGKDGIQADNDEDAALGFCYIGGGSFTISAEGDGISASASLQIDGGDFSMVTGGGSENGEAHSSQNWGGFGGGPGGFDGGSGGGQPGGRSTDTSTTTEDSTSMKGLKAGTELVLNGGTFTMDCADDAVHSNGNLTVTDGLFQIETGDDGFHAEETLTISGGDITVTESYEGLEALHILVSNGNIRLVCSDDGLNAAGGTDSSGMGGRDQMFGPGGPGGFGAGNGSITITGGDLYINSSGDGIDANGTLEISGGYTVIVGPTMGDTATLDYDTSAVISGGTFIGTGASGMAQTFSNSENQGVIAVQVGSAPAGTKITLTDQEGNVVMEHTPELGYNVVILSSPNIVKGRIYQLTVGTSSGGFEAY